MRCHGSMRQMRNRFSAELRSSGSYFLGGDGSLTFTPSAPLVFLFKAADVEV